MKTQGADPTTEQIWRWEGRPHRVLGADPTTEQIWRWEGRPHRVLGGEGEGGRTRPARARRFGVDRVKSPGADPKTVPPFSIETSELFLSI